MSRLPPQSRLRQAMIWRGTALAYAATNRRDFEAVLPHYCPDAEFIPAPELVGLGIAPTYRGHAGYVELWNDWDSAWAGHGQWEPEELIDLGDHLLVLARMRSTGEASGIGVDREVAQLLMLKDGLIAREQHYLDLAEAFEAAGLDPATR